MWVVIIKRRQSDSSYRPWTVKQRSYCYCRYYQEVNHPLEWWPEHDFRRNVEEKVRRNKFLKGDWRPENTMLVSGSKQKHQTTTAPGQPQWNPETSCVICWACTLNFHQIRWTEQMYKCQSVTEAKLPLCAATYFSLCSWGLETTNCSLQWNAEVCFKWHSLRTKGTYESHPI